MLNKAWFNCIVKVQRLDESGKETKASESYLLDAYTYTEAETRIIGIMQEVVNGKFMIQSITKTNITEVFPDEKEEKWFKAKVSLVAYDDESGKEKSSNQHFLLAASDVRHAYDRVKDVMRGSVSGYVIPAITYTKILEVFAIDDEEEQPKATITVDPETGEVIED